MSAVGIKDWQLFEIKNSIRGKGIPFTVDAVTYGQQAGTLGYGRKTHILSKKRGEH
jgi:hypothetical protein